eukprot:SAG31_NODE_1007_length_10425_cov_4.852799_2_plen_177_part_00
MNRTAQLEQKNQLREKDNLLHIRRHTRARDSISNGRAAVLRSTEAAKVELAPQAAFDATFDTTTPIRLQKNQTRRVIESGPDDVSFLEYDGRLLSMLRHVAIRGVQGLWVVAVGRRRAAGADSGAQARRAGLDPSTAETECLLLVIPGSHRWGDGGYADELVDSLTEAEPLEPWGQ